MTQRTGLQRAMSPEETRDFTHRRHEICSPINILMRLLVFEYRRIVFSIFLHGGKHRVHSLLNLADLRMYFLDEVMFELGHLFYTFALRVKLSQQGILFG